MVKVVTFVRRKPGMPRDEFQQYWRARHPEVVLALPGVRRYVQSHALPPVAGAPEPPYDGIAEVWADDTRALREMTRSPRYAAVQADEANFIDRGSMGVVVTEEHVVVDGVVGAASVKRVEFFARRPGLDVEAFQRHWRETHAPLAAAVPGVRRYVQSHTRRSAYEAGRSPAWDGVSLAWFDSVDAALASSAPAHRLVAEDRERFLAPGPPPLLLTREHIIRP